MKGGVNSWQVVSSSCGEHRIPVDDKTGGLKGSMQHWLGVYPPEFEIPTFFVVVDSDAERSHLAPAASSRTDPPSSIGIAATIHSYFHSSRVARDFADRRSKPVPPSPS